MYQVIKRKNNMKITVSQLRRIIKEEVNAVISSQGKRSLSEGHSRITARELEEWKSGNWIFEADDEKACSECGSPMAAEAAGSTCESCA